MTDYFALVGLPRRPGLDEADFQERYLRMAALWHPDAAGGDVEKFRDLQDARAVLLDPASRLRHLIALEGGGLESKGRNQPPSDLFLEVAGALDAAKRVCAKIDAAKSAIVRAGFAGERAAIRQRIEKAERAVADRIEIRLRQIAEQSETARDIAALEEIAGELVYLNRWGKELRERSFLLNV